MGPGLVWSLTTDNLRPRWWPVNRVFVRPIALRLLSCGHAFCVSRSSGGVDELRESAVDIDVDGLDVMPVDHADDERSGGYDRRHYRRQLGEIVKAHAQTSGVTLITA